MPKESVRAALLSAICRNTVTEMVLCDSDEELGTIFDQALDDVLVIQTCRYINPRQPLPKSDTWYTEVLPQLDDDRFKQFIRVSRKDFAFIMSQIEDHEVFKGKNSGKQFPIAKQLAITLYKFGIDGSGASVHNVAAMFGVGDGGTVMNVMSRVSTAILSEQSKWICWPDEEEKQRIKNSMADKLPGCVGYIDGSHINVDESPLDDPQSYYTRKQRYAIQLQAICDNDKRLRSVFVGFPGAVHDARVFANSSVGTSSSRFLSQGEWIAGDSAYANSHFVVTPFKSNAIGGTDRQRRQFNRYFSGFRVNIECAFGKLKEVFQSLKGIRIRVDRNRGHQLACDWIRACCVLYNMILPSLDINMSDFECTEDEEECQPNSESEARRNVVFDFVVNKLSL